MKKEIIQEFKKFAVVGVISTLVNYAIFSLLIKLFGVHYIISSAIGFTVGIFVSYGLNRAFTFSSSKKNIAHEASLYVLVCIFSLCLSLVVLWFTVEILKISPFIANIIAIGVSTVSNFTGLKFLVFTSK